MEGEDSKVACENSKELTHILSFSEMHSLKDYNRIRDFFGQLVLHFEENRPDLTYVRQPYTASFTNPCDPLLLDPLGASHSLKFGDG